MRIIAGNLKGREFKSPHGHKTHPMSDKIRGALFNVLGDVEGLTFLDAFAGSGALAFEAISRGAASALAIDNDRNAARALAENIQELKLGNVKAVQASASAWSENNQDAKFDIVLLDPPYDNLQDNLLEKLADRHVKPGGLAVLSYPGSLEALDLGFEIAAVKSYGDS
ncbi:MAG TPA: 16S rRNA (guanine(966)-N(2))-methyltransferase RsmD, partial [Candidatus Saccharimonadales bacterium]|nr:16S rRNA (guanine(966)-N(2))-methyltransferase RsmD [Candidatus Saccharimonadales bacterium]